MMMILLYYDLLSGRMTEHGLFTHKSQPCTGRAKYIQHNINVIIVYWTREINPLQNFQ